MTGRPWITCHLDQSLWPQEQDCLRWQFPIRASHVGVGGKGRAHHKQGRWTVPPIINVSLKCPLLYLWTPSPFWSHLRGLEAFSTLPTPAQALWEFGRGPWVKAKQRTREGCTEWTMFTSLPYISQVCFRETPGWYWYVQDRNSYPLTLLLARESVYRKWLVSIWDDFFKAHPGQWFWQLSLFLTCKLCSQLFSVPHSLPFWRNQEKGEVRWTFMSFLLSEHCQCGSPIILLQFQHFNSATTETLLALFIVRLV